MTLNGGKGEMGSLRSSGDSIEGYMRMHGLLSYRRFGRARSLRSDRADERSRPSGRTLGRYVVIEQKHARSLRSDQASARARSRRSDRAEHAFGRCVATLIELLSNVSCFLRKAFRKEESILKKYLSKKVIYLSNPKLSSFNGGFLPPPNKVSKVKSMVYQMGILEHCWPPKVGLWVSWNIVGHQKSGMEYRLEFENGISVRSQEWNLNVVCW
ncbi:hypothetical protein DY000_02046613 [Brassica cretica]|uniref:Uncharacterized protein n=1 Tax=Brassica cretica TaxID=69181 RepID=A0ABQ7ETT0_BRACR|nr:hypothetical protein DY000_02046613 [Brassica cretica]